MTKRSSRRVPVSQQGLRRSGQLGLTLIEIMVAMVVTAMVLLPTLGFITMSMGEQASARLLSTETSNLAAVDLAVVRDVTNARAVAASVDANGLPQTVSDCLDGPGSGGSVVLGLVSSQNHRIVYSLVQSAGPGGGTLWRRECPNQNFATGTPLGDPLLQINPPVAGGTEGAIIGQRIESAASSCPKGDGGQAVQCREVTLRLQSMARSSTGNEIEAVVVQATRRNDTYAVPMTPPIARFSYRPASVEDRDEVLFDGRPSRDPRGGTLSYKWSFGPPVNKTVPADGSFSLPGEAKTALTMPERTAGGPIPAMEVTLTVKSSESGETNSTTQTVDVDAKGPTAELSPVPPVVVNRNTRLDLKPVLTTYSGATIQNVTWKWGDEPEEEEDCNLGGTVCNQTKSHDFPNVGYITVKVSVVDSNNKRAESVLTVKVEPDIVYVSNSRGNDSLAGGCGLAITIPCKSIGKGLDRAKSLVKPRVYVAEGLYASFEMKSNIDLAGGYTEQFDGAGLPSEITGGTLPGDPTGIVISKVNNAVISGFKVRTKAVSSGTTQGVLIDQSGSAGKVTLQNVEVGYGPAGSAGYRGQGIEPAAVLIAASTVDLKNVRARSPQATGAGSSAYALRIARSNVSVDGGEYEAQSGTAGASATPLENPVAGKACRGGDGENHKKNGTSKCGGGAGGSGGNSTSVGFNSDGNPGLRGDGERLGVGYGGQGGSGGSRRGLTRCDAGAGIRGQAASDALSGGGDAGGGGKQVRVGSEIRAGETWVGHDGLVGGDGGTGAGGGGGGGGAGNCALLDDADPAGGGAGGGGGQGGSGGTTGGKYGGGSFGVYAYDSTLTVTDASIRSGAGGAGGRGRDARPGDAGGDGGHSGETNRGEGGGGGGGGAGGGGGGGAGGGEGGPSILIYVRKQRSTSVPTSSALPAPGAQGPGGSGGSPGARGLGGTGGTGDGSDAWPDEIAKADDGAGGGVGARGGGGDAGFSEKVLIQ